MENVCPYMYALGVCIFFDILFYIEKKQEHTNLQIFVQ